MVWEEGGDFGKSLGLPGFAHPLLPGKSRQSCDKPQEAITGALNDWDTSPALHHPPASTTSAQPNGQRSRVQTCHFTLSAINTGVEVFAARAGSSQVLSALFCLLLFLLQG